MLDGDHIRDEEHKHQKLSYNQINDLLFAGNNMCCQTHFEMELLSRGIAADISLEAERLDNPQGVKYFFWFPWREDTAPATELMDLLLDVFDQLSARRVKTYVHCKNGHGRTTTFLASFFIHSKGVSVDKALELVRAKRPSMHLNDAQKDFLIEFSKKHKKSGRPFLGLFAKA